MKWLFLFVRLKRLVSMCESFSQVRRAPPFPPDTVFTFLARSEVARQTTVVTFFLPTYRFRLHLQAIMNTLAMRMAVRNLWQSMTQKGAMLLIDFAEFLRPVARIVAELSEV